MIWRVFFGAEKGAFMKSPLGFILLAAAPALAAAGDTRLAEAAMQGNRAAVRSLLPADDSNEGFDNIADALAVLPARSNATSRQRLRSAVLRSAIRR